MGAGDLHRPRCRHPHRHSQDPTGLGRLSGIAAIRGDSAGQGLPVRRRGRRRPCAAATDLPAPPPQPAARADQLHRAGERIDRTRGTVWIVASPVVDWHWRRGQDAAGASAGREPGHRVPRRSVVDRPGAALGARSRAPGGRHNARYTRGSAAVATRCAARRAAAPCRPARVGQLRTSDRGLRGSRPRVAQRARFGPDSRDEP